MQTFIGKSISTQDWKDHLYAYFQKNGGEEKVKLLDTVDWNVCQSCSRYMCRIDIIVLGLALRGRFEASS